MITEELKKLYTVHTGHEPETIDELPSSGSNRRYFRLTGTPTLIGVSGESVEENRAFLYMAEHFRRKGLPVPDFAGKSSGCSGKRLSAAYAGMRRYSRARSSVARASLIASGSRNGSTHFASTTPSVIAPVRV